MAEITKADFDQFAKEVHGTLNGHTEILTRLLEDSTKQDTRIKDLEDRPALKGEKGDKGDKGDPGTVDPATAERLNTLEARLQKLEGKHEESKAKIGTIVPPKINYPRDNQLVVCSPLRVHGDAINGHEVELWCRYWDEHGRENRKCLATMIAERNSFVFDADICDLRFAAESGYRQFDLTAICDGLASATITVDVEVGRPPHPRGSE